MSSARSNPLLAEVLHGQMKKTPSTEARKVSGEGNIAW
jgi:hypothetical protein